MLVAMLSGLLERAACTTGQSVPYKEKRDDTRVTQDTWDTCRYSRYLIRGQQRAGTPEVGLKAYEDYKKTLELQKVRATVNANLGQWSQESARSSFNYAIGIQDARIYFWNRHLGRFKKLWIYPPRSSFDLDSFTLSLNRRNRSSGFIIIDVLRNILAAKNEWSGSRKFQLLVDSNFRYD